ncbi:hypothetical protein YSY43_17630 [Paenibacillus sp. YSY-4.3]
MTAQISDEIIYQGHSYSLIGIEKEWPFDPKKHGFKPIMISTACWRGYYSKYAIVGMDLLLSEFTTGLEDDPPVWRDIRAKKVDRVGEAWTYNNVNLELDYSGGIIIARNFIREFYLHMGFHCPHCYEIVCELIFEKGKLVRVKDFNEKVKSIRERIREIRKSNTQNYSGKKIEELIRQSFSLTYDDKWKH